MGHGVGCSLFREQVVWVGRLWEGWSEVEQVVVVYSLLRRLPPVPARFLTNLLHQAHSTDPAHADIATAEAAANDPAWVREVGGEGVKDGGASDLLHHLPLLRPSNTEAKLQYLSIIPKVLAQALASAGRGEECGGSLEDARQVLSYSLLHPAITGEERRALTHWLTALHARLPRPASQGYPPATTPSTINNNNNSNIRNSCSSNNNNSSTCSGSNKSRWSTDPPLVPDTGQARAYPSPSHVPWDDVGWCSSSVGVGSIGGGGVGIGVGGGSGVIGGVSVGSSSGVCGGEAPQSPNNSATSSSRSSGGDSNTEEPPCHPHPGMRDVGLWLKSLRLHKYAPLLCHLSYTELVALDEVTLEAQGVTKGARHKIVLSVHKLKERHKQLHQIEKEVVSGGHLLSCLNELKSIILTPFPPPPSSSTETPLTTPPPSTPPQDLPSTTGTSSTPSTTSVSGSSTVAPPFPSTPSSSTSSSTISLSTSSSSTSFPTTIISTTSTTTTTTTTATSSSSTPSSLSTSASSSACSLRGEEGAGEPEREGRGESGEGGEGGATTPDSDLPSQFTRVMGKVCTQLLVSVRADEECVSGFLALVERCLCHEAFTATQARRLTSWKHQVLRVARPLPPRTKDQRHGRRWSQQLSGDGGFLGGSFRVGGSRVVGGGGGSQRHNQLPPGLLAKGFPPPQAHPLFPLPPTVSLGGLMSPRNSLPGLPSLGVPGLLSPQQFLAKRPSLQETPSEQLRPHITLQRTRSAPSRPHQLPLTTSRVPHPAVSSLGPDLRIPGGGVLGGVSALDPSSHYSTQHSYMSTAPPTSASPDPADTDITDRLESLCLSVTEHALG